jgi:tRNA(Ile)-lysidine synthase
MSSAPQETLLEQCRTLCVTHELISPESRVVVAVSGGADSVALLHVLHTLQDTLGCTIHVATLDHGLRGETGAADADFVATLAGSWGLGCTRTTINVPIIMDEHGLGVEAAARLARYTFLLGVALEQDADYIALAHHQQDQAETILMNIIRGSGLDGLSGMALQTPLTEAHLLPDWETVIPDDHDDFLPDDITLIRPLLHTPQHHILAYVQAHELNYRDDISNQDTTRLRNAIRHELLPQLRDYNANMDTALARLADTVSHDLQVLTTSVEQVAAVVLEWTETQPIDANDEPGEAVFVDRTAFGEQPIALQRRLIRKIIMELWPGAQDIAFDLVESARTLILTGRTSTSQSLYDDIRLQVGYDEVIIGYGGAPVYPANLPALATGQHRVLTLDDEQAPFKLGKLELIMYWVIEGRSTDLRPPTPLEVTLAIPEDATLALRTWEHGDRFCPLGMGGKSQKLSDVFVNAKVPVYYRDQVPLLTINDEIAWILAPTASGPVSKIANTFAVRSQQDAMLRLRWQRPTMLPVT